MNDKLLKWFIFGVLLALVPIASSWLYRLIFGGDSTLEALLSKGELLIITAGLCAAGVGSIIGTGNSYKNEKIISGGLSVVILLLSALVFAIVSEPSLATNPPDTGVIMTASIWIYIFALLSSGACAYLSE